MKQAVILAAGRGSRLSAVSNGAPKCLVEVSGRALIDRQLSVLEGLGIARICVVVGHRADEVRETVGSRAEFVTNENFADTNSLYSLWLARQWVTGSFILMNCDVLAHPDVYNRVIAVNGCALAYDSTSGDEDEHMKVTLSPDGLVHNLCKSTPADQADGENVGILQFDSAAASRLFSEAHRIIDGGDVGHWAPAAVSSLAKMMPVRAVDVADLPWAEIDFPQDLRFAERSVCAAIDTTGPQRLTAEIATTNGHSNSIASKVQRS